MSNTKAVKADNKTASKTAGKPAASKPAPAKPASSPDSKPAPAAKEMTKAQLVKLVEEKDQEIQNLNTLAQQINYQLAASEQECLGLHREVRFHANEAQRVSQIAQSQAAELAELKGETPESPGNKDQPGKKKS